MNSPEDKQMKQWPKVVTALEEAEVQVRGIEAWILQGKNHQLVFFEMEPGVKVPEHSHGYDQWGIMVSGGMELIIDQRTRVIMKGDEYLIPAGAKHCARFLTKSRVIDFFSERSRYTVKSSRQSKRSG